MRACMRVLRYPLPLIYYTYIYYIVYKASRKLIKDYQSTRFYVFPAEMLPYKLIENSKLRQSDLPHNITTPTPSYKHKHPAPVIFNLPSYHHPTSSTPLSLTQYKPLQQQHIFSNPHSNPPLRKTEQETKPSIILPDPTSGQPLPAVLPSTHYIVNPLLPVPAANGTHSPPTLVSRQAVVQHPIMMINGSKYLLYVPSSGGQPSLVPVSSPSPAPGNAAVYTSAPVQLINASPPASVKPAFQLPIKSEFSPKSSRPAPPPLLSIGSTDSPSNHIKTCNTDQQNEKPFIYLQSPPTTCQKLYILPVVSNSSAKNGHFLMPVDRCLPPVSTINSKLKEESRMTSSVPIYRFGDAVKFINSPPQFSSLTRSS